MSLVGSRLRGMVHVSEVAWGRVRNPADVLRMGQKLQVQVIQVQP